MFWLTNFEYILKSIIILIEISNKSFTIWIIYVILLSDYYIYLVPLFQSQNIRFMD